MAALHAAGTLLTMPDMHVELGDERSDRSRDVFLVLRPNLLCLNIAAALKLPHNAPAPVT